MDTDLPVVGQALARDDLSYDAAIDVVRVDVHAADLTLIDSREHLVPDERDLPLSFGIASDGLGPAVLVRVRAFAAALSEPGQANGVTTLEPLPTATVDRLVRLELPDAGVKRVFVMLSGDCLGRRASFSPPSTCVDGTRQESTPDVTDEPPSAGTRAGTWQLAQERPCAGAPPDGAVCIPGGFMLIGDEALRGTASGVLSPYDPVPMRPVAMSPFHMDRTEMTVGKARARMLEDPDIVPELPRTDAMSNGCTFLGLDLDENDALPLNCTTVETAAALCAAFGGRLPSEAEWEYAARGRGRRWTFPWGNAWPECCTAVAGGTACGVTGVVAAASEDHFQGCATRDVSRDGLLHLGGNLSELTRDRLVPYDEGCWSAPGILLDPTCAEPLDAPYAARGSPYNEPATSSSSAIRRSRPKQDVLRSVGLRCVYEQNVAP